MIKIQITDETGQLLTKRPLAYIHIEYIWRAQTVFREFHDADDVVQWLAAEVDRGNKVEITGVSMRIPITKGQE